jgi:hypothetical protein
MRKVDKMTREQLSTENDKLENELGPLREEYKRIQDLIHKKANRQRDVLKQMAKVDYEAAAAQGVTDWPKLIDTNLYESSYEMLTIEIGKRCPLGSIAHTGYYPETMQRCFQLRFMKNDEAQIQEAKALIEDVMPHLKPLKNGLIRFDILEKTCSYHSSYAMAYDTNTKQWYAGAESRISRNAQFGTTFATLEEALRYVSAYIFYESNDPADSDEDDNDY